jgi:hypothetical protein
VRVRACNLCSRPLCEIEPVAVISALEGYASPAMSFDVRTPALSPSRQMTDDRAALVGSLRAVSHLEPALILICGEFPSNAAPYYQPPCRVVAGFFGLITFSRAPSSCQREQPPPRGNIPVRDMPSLSLTFARLRPSFLRTRIRSRVQAPDLHLSLVHSSCHGCSPAPHFSRRSRRAPGRAKTPRRQRRVNEGDNFEGERDRLASKRAP